MHKRIAVYDNSISARTYLSYIAEQAGGFACIGRDGKLYIRTIGESIVELSLNHFQNYKWGEKIKITRVRYEDGIQLFEAGDTTGNTLYINQENMYIVDQEQIDNIYNQLNGLEVYSFEGDSIIDPAIDIGDLLLIDGKYVIYQGSSQYGGKFKASISSKIQCKAKEETMTRIPSQTIINRKVQSQIDEVEGKIEQTVTEVGTQSKKISKITQTVDKISAKVEDTADTTTSKESLSGTVKLEKINKSEPIRVEIHPTAESISYLYPRADLFPSEALFLKARTLRFTNTTTNEYVDYELPTDLLYFDADNYDEFVLDYSAQSCVVNKRVGYNADGTTYVLNTPKTIKYEYPKIQLTDGDYTVTLLGYHNAYLFVRLMVQNIYTTQFATKVEVNSEILQTANEIKSSVNKKLENYPTTPQMKSEIKQTANNIELLAEEVDTITGDNSIKNGDFKKQLENWIISAQGGTVEIKTHNNKNYANLQSMYNTTSMSQIVSGLFKDIDYSLEFDVFDDNPYDINVTDNAIFSVSISQNVTEEEMEKVYEENIQVTETEVRKKINFRLNRNSQNVEISFKLKANGYLYDVTSVMISNVVLAGGNITEKLAKLNIATDEINSTVTKVENNLEQAKSEIKQTTDGITSTVSKKVGKDEIISKINQSAETVGIDADKIELSAKDVLNLLAGNEINISSHNISIKGDVLEIDKYGNIILNSQDGTPALTIKNSNGDEIEMYPSNFNMIWNYVGNIIGAYLQKGGLYIESSNGNYINLDADLGCIEISTNGTIKKITGNN